MVGAPAAHAGIGSGALVPAEAMDEWEAHAMLEIVVSSNARERNSLPHCARFHIS
jgi:hypothetical protein